MAHRGNRPWSARHRGAGYAPGSPAARVPLPRGQPDQEPDIRGHHHTRPDRPPAHPRAHRARGEAPQRRHPGSADIYRRAHEVLSGGVASSYQLRDPWPIYLERGDGPKVWDVDGNEYLDFHNGFGSMVQGHAHPVIGAAIGRALCARHALRRADRGRDRRRRGAPAPLGPAPLALHELRLGVDDGRDPDRARLHGPRHRDEDLRLLPRPPRHGDGLDRHRVRQDRRPREPRLAALRRRHPAGDRRHDDRRAVQRRRRDGAPHRAPRRGGPQARLRDHGGGDDEPRGRAPRGRLPRPRSATSAPATGSC